MSPSLIRWSGSALMLGGILDVLLYFFRASEDMYAFFVAVSVVGVGLVLFGIMGLHSLQARQSGRVGFIAVATVTIGLIMAVVMQIWILLLPRVPIPNTPIVYGTIAVQVLGFVLLGISMNRAAVFPRHSGTGLIIVSLLAFVAGRLLLGIFLVGLGHLTFSGKVTSTKPT